MLCAAPVRLQSRAWLPRPAAARPRRAQPRAGSRLHLSKPQTAAAARRQVAAAANSRSGRSSGSRAAAEGPACPLHACLREFGFADLAPFSEKRHLALSAETVERDVQPKLAALAAEGLMPQQAAKLLLQTHSPLPCDYVAVFAPNLALLAGLLALRQEEYVPPPGQPQLTAVGALLAEQPSDAAKLLSRSPELIGAMLRWAEGELGVSRAALAGSANILNALRVSAEAGRRAREMLSGLGCDHAAAAKLFLCAPSIFRLDPVMILRPRLRFLQQALRIESTAALTLVQRNPRLILQNIEGTLPGLLACLDECMGEAGAGRRLVLKDPRVGTAIASTAQREIAGMKARGLSHAEIVAQIEAFPSLLARNAASFAQQQKRDWFEQASPWPATLLDSVPRVRAASLRRLASRHDFMVQHGLELYSIESLARSPDTEFAECMGKKLGRPFSEADWRAWVRGWLDTESGRRWGFKPRAD